MPCCTRRFGYGFLFVAALAAGSSPVSAEASSAAAPGGPVRVSAHPDFFEDGADLLAAGPPRPGYPAGAAGLSTLPPRWCGGQRSTDDVRHAASAAAQVKVVYAYPRGEPDRFHLYKDLIQRDVRAAHALVAAASRGKRSIRFDMGTDCARAGEQYVDIQSVALPHDASYYGYDATSALKLLRADLKLLLGLRGVRNVTTYVDRVMPGGTSGIATLPEDDTPGAGNDANRGGQHAFVFGDGSPEFSFERTRTFIHETTHNLGAVHDGARHATGLGHCFDGEDVMCYQDGGPFTPPGWTGPRCPGGARFDCRSDDYFAARPARRSYLARHWNLYDSDFMCKVATCSDADDAVAGALGTALRRAKASLRRQGVAGVLRSGGLRLRFVSPHAGSVRLVVQADGRRVAQGERTFAAPGSGLLRARLLPAARRLRLQRRLRIGVRVSFTDSLRTVARRSRLLVVRQLRLSN